MPAFTLRALFFVFVFFPKVTGAGEKLNSVLLENILTELIKKVSRGFTPKESLVPLNTNTN